MFHIPAHLNTVSPAAQFDVSDYKPHGVRCPRCGGNPDCDETGRPYTCFYCYDEGYVSLDVSFEEYLRDADMYAYSHAPLVRGDRPLPRAVDDDEPAIIARAARYAEQQSMGVDDLADLGFDDIPF